MPAPIPAGGQHPNKWADMNNEHRKLAAKKRKHRAKVRTLARKMTTRRLHNAVIAIGFAADYDTGITGNFGVKSLANMTAKRRLGRDPSEQISESTLHRAIAELEKLGVLTVSRTDAGLQTANAYMLDYEWSAKKNAERPVSPGGVTETTDSEWLASLEPVATVTEIPDDAEHDAKLSVADCPGCKRFYDEVRSGKLTMARLESIHNFFVHLQPITPHGGVK